MSPKLSHSACTFCNFAKSPTLHSIFFNSCVNSSIASSIFRNRRSRPDELLSEPGTHSGATLFTASLAKALMLSVPVSTQAFCNAMYSSSETRKAITLSRFRRKSPSESRFLREHLDRFPTNFGRNASRQQFDGNDQPELVFDPLQVPFQTFQRTASHAHPFAGL